MADREETSLRVNPAAVAAGVGVAVGAAAIASGNALVDFALDAQNPLFGRAVFHQDPSEPPAFPIKPAYRHLVQVNNAWIQEAREIWLEDALVEEVFRSVDGGSHHLAATIYHSAKPTRAWAVLVHGYRGTHAEMDVYALQYASQGYNVLSCDLRAHGDSDGRWIGMGWADAADVLGWVDYLAQRFGDGIEVVLHGHSMGATAVLCTAACPPRPCIRAIVADCGFTGVWEIFRHHLIHTMHLLPRPLLDIANVCWKARGGWDFREASALRAVALSQTPTLFIHGTEDKFVPCRMSEALYDACAAPVKELHLVEGAGHIMSVFIDPQAYEDMVFGFLDALE